MKKLILLMALVFCSQNSKAQEIYFKTGKNFTQYNFKSGNGSNPHLQSGNGNFYEMGYVFVLNNEKLQYAVGLGLNEYNAIGGDINSTYDWNTQYLGIANTLSWAFVNLAGFQGTINTSLGIEHLIYGKQNLNGEYLDLSKQKEFSGIWLSPKLGIQGAYNVDNDIILSFGYAYVKSLNISNSTDEKLGFSTNQIQFGVHFTF